MRTDSIRPKSLAILTTLSLAIAALVAVPGRATGFDRAEVWPPRSHPYGLSYQEWTVIWWKWLTSIPRPVNPLFDDTGEDAAVKQRGPVWFLSGAFAPPVERTITVPKGTALFFPIINLINDYPCPDPDFHPAPGQSLAEFLTEGARFYMDQVTELRVTIDGVNLRNPFNYRATSRLFFFKADETLVGPDWDPCALGTVQPAVSDGFWVMLKPLDVGKHTLSFYGKGPWTQDVTYHIHVVRSHR